MTTWDPKAVAKRLDVDAKADVRPFLRERHPEHPERQAWLLDREMVAAVGQHLVSRGR